MSQFLGNLPPPSRSRSSCGSGATSGGQPPTLSSAVDPTLVAVVTPSPDEVGSLPLISSHGRRVQEDVVPPSKSLKPAP